MTQKRLGNFFMILGAALIFSAVALLIFNRKEANTAEKKSQEVLSELVQRMEAENHESDGTLTESPGAYGQNDPVVTIDGHDYMGYIYLTDLGIELPVMDTWDDERLAIAPCRFSGRVQDNNLVIMAHNYEEHFGKLSMLEQGGLVYFTDVEGNQIEYRVTAREVLLDTAVKEIKSGDYDLTLFTCNYSGQRRVAVYCQRSN